MKRRERIDRKHQIGKRKVANSIIYENIIKEPFREHFSGATHYSHICYPFTDSSEGDPSRAPATESTAHPTHRPGIS